MNDLTTTIITYGKIAVAALLPVIISVVFYLLDKFTAFGKIKYKYRQVIYGVFFGVLAVLGTHFGIPISGAQVNCRDAAVLTAGLFFGAPAGIIAGIIGGVERWIAAYWGIGVFTKIACTVSTILAGFYAGLLRKYMFDNKKPSTFISLAIGTVIEVFHMTMVLVTHPGDQNTSLEIVKTCSVVMIPANGLSVMISAFIFSLIEKRKKKAKGNQARISQTIQRWLLVTVVLAFSVTSLFILNFQNSIADSQADSLLTLALEETTADISDASDSNLLSLAYMAKNELETSSLEDIAEKYSFTEISLVDENGIISESSDPDNVGFDFSSGKQAAEFLCLLGDVQDFVQEYGPMTEDRETCRKFAGIKTDTGFLQVGYDEENIQKDMAKQIVGITKNRHVGQTGYVMILDSHLNIISAPSSLLNKNLAQASPRVEMPDVNITFDMTINDIECRCRYQIAEGYYIFSVLPEAEAIQMRDAVITVNSFMEILVFAILFILVYLLIKKVVVNQIKTVNNSLAKITAGDLNEVVNVRSNEEFSSLSDDINSTVDTLKQYIAEASARIDAELEFAKNIQASALPNVFPAFPKRKDFEIYASMQPAKEVGGDFYDFYITDNDTLNFLIADVSGKGIPAAMFMMRAMTELKSLTEAEQSIDEVFNHGNEALCAGNDAGMFVTAWQGGLDLATGVVRFANAGHNPPLVRHSDGKFEFLKSRSGFVLAGMEGVRYKMQELALAPGDIIYLYTDGVTEATNVQGELYGEERLLTVLNSDYFESTEEVCKLVKGDVDAFVGDAPQFDDITMVALKYVGIPSVHFDEATIQDITTVTDFVEAELEKIDCPMKIVMQINVAIDELFSNIVRYGYPDKSGPITVKFILHDDPKTVYIRFEDEGIPYNPLTKEDPDITLSAEERSIGGLGVYVVKKTMDDVKYKYEDGKNILTIKKFI